MAFVASANADAATITIPASAQAGDIAILIDAPAGGDESAMASSNVTITGWTKFRNDYSAAGAPTDGGVQRVQMFWRILQAGDPNTAVTGSNTEAVGGARRKVMLVFRPNKAITNVSINGLQSEFTTGNPASQSLATGGKSRPIIAFAVHRGNAAISPRTFTPTEDGSVSSGVTVVFVYKIYNSASQAISAIDADDEGALNYIGSFWMEFW